MSMDFSITAGTTSNVLGVFLQDNSVATGAGLAGLVFGSSGLTCYYKRSNGTASVAVTLATISTLGTWETGGFKAVDGTNMIGLYEFHPPDAALATGAKWVKFYFTGAANLGYNQPFGVRQPGVQPYRALGAPAGP